MLVTPTSHVASFGHSRPAQECYACISIGGESYAIESRHVHRVTSWRPDAALPNVPTYVLGALSIDGMRVPVVDLHAPFGQTSATEDGKLQVLVLRRYEDAIGIIIDALEEPITLTTGSASPARPLGSPNFLNGCAQLRNRRVTLLNNDHIFELTRADMVAHLLSA